MTFDINATDSKNSEEKIWDLTALLHTKTVETLAAIYGEIHFTHATDWEYMKTLNNIMSEIRDAQGHIEAALYTLKNYSEDD